MSYIRPSVMVLFSAVLLGTVATPTFASGPSAPPDFGVVDPLDNNPNTVGAGGAFTGSCPWPNSVDQFLPGVQKCLPGNIAWTENGVRIVSDPLIATAPDGTATGAFTFWCQSKVGLRFMVTATGLTPNTSYDVVVHDLIGNAPTVGTIARLRTGADGAGGVIGTVRLQPGDYDFGISVGDALVTVTGDEIGFEVM